MTIKPLIKKRFTGKEFKNSTVLNEGLTLEDIQDRQNQRNKCKSKKLSRSYRTKRYKAS